MVIRTFRMAGIRFRWLSGLGLLALTSCGDCRPVDPDVPCPGNVTLAVTDLTLPLGTRASIGVISGRDDCPVAWEVDDASILELSGNYRYLGVTALAVGRTTVRARRGATTSGNCAVTVVANTVTDLTLTPDSLSLVDSDSTSVGLVFLEMRDTEGRQAYPLAPVVWTSSDTTIASFDFAVDVIVAVRGLSPGRAEITASYSGVETAGGTLSDTCIVHVTPPPSR